MVRQVVWVVQGCTPVPVDAALDACSASGQAQLFPVVGGRLTLGCAACMRGQGAQPWFNP